MTAQQHTPRPRRGRNGPGGGVPNVAAELRRLTPRDRWLLDLLGDHQVFTTEQMTALAFDNPHTARQRLNRLAIRGVLARFRDYVRPGSQSWRWSLGWVGAAYLAARDGQPTPRPAANGHRLNRLAASPRLDHLLGVNGFFVDLAATARHAPGTRLGGWWSERRCQAVTGQLVRPDGRGEWTEHAATVRFWLEYDTGSEATHRVAAKLDGYANLANATDEDVVVLVRMQTGRQEDSLRSRLARHPAATSGRLVVATSNTEAGHPAGPVWTPAGRGAGPVRLAHLPRPSA